MKTLKYHVPLTMLVLLTLTACKSMDNTSYKDGKVGVCSAIAVIRPLGDAKAHGTVKFIQQADGVRVTAKLTGFEPDGTHGFHIHVFGDLNSEDGTSAGGHFNPENTMHGSPDSPERHAGDLGNIHTDAEGNVRFEKKFTGFTVGGKNSILGRAVVIHAGADDLESQPSGNAGPRIAVGVIGIMNPEK